MYNNRHIVFILATRNANEDFFCIQLLRFLPYGLLHITKNIIIETKLHKYEENYFVDNNGSMRVLPLVETTNTVFKGVGSRAIPHKFKF